MVIEGRVVDTEPVDRPTFADRQVPAVRAEAVCDRLLDAAPEVVAGVPLSEEVREALAQARAVRTHGAQRRQRLYVAKLLRAEDLDAVEAALDAGPVDPMLRWRDRLLAEGDRAMDELLLQRPRADRRRIRTLVRQVDRAASAEARERTLAALLALLHEDG